MVAVMSLTQEELHVIIAETLAQIAPEADFDDLEGDEDIREALDIDSFDFLNFLIALNERVGVEIPEADYGLVNTLEGVTTYILSRR